MRTREALLKHLWQTAIDSNLCGGDIAEVIAFAKAHPGAPFTEARSVMERLLASGVLAQDICTLRRDAAYRAVFRTLYSLDDPGVDGDDVMMLHESLLGADPNGIEGRPSKP
jgi:hypothetical protein